MSIARRLIFLYSVCREPSPKASLVRATLHVKSVKADPRKPGAINVSYNVVTEVMATPDMPICDIHETIQ